MRTLALFEGTPKVYTWEGKEVKTSIFKDPIQVLRSENKTLVGNQQANPKYHGGPFKEIYSYPIEAYEYWKKIFSSDKVELGMLGENIITEALDEDSVYVGEQYQIGSMIVEVSQPRMPCFKLNLRLSRTDGDKLFAESPASGIYWKIINDGEIFIGDKITKLVRTDLVPSIKFKELLSVMYKRKTSPELLKKIIDFPGIDPVIIEIASKL